MSAGREQLGMHVNRTVATTIPSAALDDLNWMRGLAAVNVLAGHVRGAFFVELPPGGSLLAKVAYLLTGFGHQAVVVFFVLSGFFIGTSVIGTTRDGTWSWQRFALRRFTRLYVVLLPALALTVAWDSLGLSLFGMKGIYIGQINAPFLALTDLRTTYNLRTLIGNVAFLQELLVPPFGSNGPLWSLSYEFWAYLAFPLLFRGAAGIAPLQVKLLSAAAGVLLLLVLGGLFPFYFSIWALGALVAFAHGSRPFRTKNPLVPFTASVLFAGALLVARGRLLHHRLPEDFVLGVATAVFVAARLAVANARDPATRSTRYVRWGDVIAGFSYTLYATHYPVVAFCQAALVGEHRWAPSPSRVLLAVVLGLSIVVLYAYPLARLTEARTDHVRRWLERHAPLRARAAEPSPPS
jgi:peptidoglycan/LPS O-acetylase OafA/YrhL